MAYKNILIILFMFGNFTIKSFIFQSTRFIIIYILLCKCNFDFVKQMSMVKKQNYCYLNFTAIYIRILKLFFFFLRFYDTRNRDYSRIIIIEDVNVYYLFEYSVLFSRVLKYNFFNLYNFTLNKITFYHNIFLDLECSYYGYIDRAICVGVFFIFLFYHHFLKL